MKKVICFILILCIIGILGIIGFAEETTYYEEYGVYFDKTNGVITAANTSFISFDIPEKIDNVYVTTVADNAFKDCALAETITLPEKITQIGHYAFSGCIKLTNVHLPSGLKMLGYRAFQNCTELEEITIPKLTDTYYYYGSKGEWIYGCTDLKKVIIEEGATQIPHCAFQNCVYADEFVIPDSVLTVGENAFSGCTQLTQLPKMEGVTVIGSRAFEKCKNITHIGDISEKLEKIDDAAFEGCIGLTTVALNGDVFTHIGAYAFAECTYLTKITLPPKLTELGYRAFENCISLTELEIPKYTDTYYYYGSKGEWIYGCTDLEKIVIEEGATQIPNRAFQNCIYFEEIVIPDSVVSVSEYAFANCTQLTKIPEMNNVTYIGVGAFSSCKGIESLDNLPSTIIGIDSNAFQNCIGIKEITALPSKIEYLNDYVFADCLGLEKVELAGKRLVKIGAYAFSNCKSLEQITLPSRLEKLGFRVFENCISLTELVIPQYTDTYYYYGSKGEWIYGCTDLGKIVIEEGATQIPNRAFQNCIYFEEIVIPDSVVSVSEYAFASCIQLKRVPPMNGVTALGIGVFMDCTGIGTLDNLPSGLENIGNYCFANCTGLENVEKLPACLELVGSYAFDGCKYIEKIILPDNLLTINEYAFRNNTYLGYIYIPDSVTTIGSNVFSGSPEVTIYGMDKSVAQSYATTYGLPFVILSNSSVTGVSLNKISTTLTVGETETLTATVAPSDATNKAVLWSSSNESVATVLGGVVTAKAAGTAVITVTTIDGSKTATCTVTVEEEAEIPDEGLVDSGTDANGIDWYFYESGLLKIYGTGVMEDYSKTSAIPWYDERQNILEIEIGDGITHIGNRSFYNCVVATKATIPSSVETIGTYAFRNCAEITIYGESGTYAETYANANSIPFVNTKPVELKYATVDYVEGASAWYFDVEVADYLEDATVYAAAYDESGRMLGVSSEEFMPEDITTVVLSKASNADYVKVFVVADELQFITYAETVDL